MVKSNIGPFVLIPSVKPNSSVKSPSPKSKRRTMVAPRCRKKDSDDACKCMLRERRPNIITENDLQSFLKGEAVRPKSLTAIYIERVPILKYSDLRALLASLGIQSKWIRNLAYTDNKVLELLVFKEKGQEISRRITEKSSAFKLLPPDYDPLGENSKELKKSIGRLKRNLAKLPEGMHMVKKELSGQLLKAEHRLKRLEIQERLPANPTQKPTPKAKTRPPSHKPSISIKVAGWNAEGLAGKEDDLKRKMKELNIDFVFICETWAREDSRIPEEQTSIAEDVMVYSPARNGNNKKGRPYYGTALMDCNRIDKKKLKTEIGISDHSI